MDLLFFVAGLLVGWNVLPQPAWVRALWERAVKYAKGGDRE